MAKAKKMIKKKLSPAERSQIARDRWAKIRAGKAAQDKPDPVKEWVDEAVKDGLLTPTPPVVEQETKAGRDENGVPPVVGLGDGTITPNGTFIPSSSPVPPEITVAPVVNLEPPPAPQLAPVKAPKPKRYTGPKEFSVALKAAESRLAKALTERAEAAAKMAFLQAEIPSLMGIIQALKGSGNYTAPAPYDFSGGMPNSQAFQPPVPQAPQAPMNLQAILQAAQPAAPAFKSTGGAMQFGPDVVGSLEGPEDDDIDKFITGPAAGGSGWIGG